MKNKSTLFNNSSRLDHVLAHYDMKALPINHVDNPLENVEPKKSVTFVRHLSPLELIDSYLNFATCHLVQEDSATLDYDLLVSRELILQSDNFLQDPLGVTWSQGCIVDQKKFPFNSSKQKKQILSEIENALFLIAKASPLKQKLITIADELFTNAIYNAPVKNSGEHPNQKKSRVEPVALQDNNVATIYLGWGEKFVAIGCEDPFGSLDNLLLAKRIRNALVKGKEAINFGAGGAGLGTMMVFSSSQSFTSFVRPSRKTVMLSVNSLERRDGLKNLHICEQGEDSHD